MQNLQEQETNEQMSVKNKHGLSKQKWTRITFISKYSKSNISQWLFIFPQPKPAPPVKYANFVGDHDIHRCDAT